MAQGSSENEVQDTTNLCSTHPSLCLLPTQGTWEVPKVTKGKRASWALLGISSMSVTKTAMQTHRES